MDELIVRSLQGRISEEEAECLLRWREESIEHEESYQHVAAAWRATRSYERRLRVRPPAHETIIAEAARRGASGRRGWSRLIQLGTVTAAALAIGLAIGHWSSRPSRSDSGGEIVTGAEGMTTARLPDGTMIRLAPESRLVLQPGGATREVSLAGRAFFAVAHDPDRPFRVRTGAGDARVLGTRFELSTRERDLRLVVVEGRVVVSSAGKELELVSHQVGHVRQGAAPAAVEVGDVWTLLSWMGGFLAFESTPLADVRHELERRFGLSLVFEDDELARQTVTVSFNDEPLDTVVGVICQLVEANCVIEDSTVRMRSM